jgi:hypothetical protein
MNFSSSWYSVWRPGYLISESHCRKNIRKKHGCPDLHRKLDVAAVIDHIVERLLHVCAKMRPILQHDTIKSAENRQKVRISLLAKISTKIFKLGSRTSSTLRVACKLEGCSIFRSVEHLESKETRSSPIVLIVSSS